MKNKQTINATIRPKEDDGGLFSILPNPKEDDGGLFSMLPNMMQSVIPLDLMVLPAYCNVCHLRRTKLGL